ncbi:PspC domain-containing protein [Pseudoflavitalea sp. G-6-1-2]|uniref:PspC domain-containing protein n=1 Tax=Pseudoflavitalea sp. G-6-1-2 TaxID=2728841 RepID=UPI00146D2357|nr:PspC domain-containing protein [Pseudoflavitalea sp. G-6-1-2]NML20037.1 PspC domain-containing protein [Pseudoflavitalea sp. G-6-1-2]
MKKVININFQGRVIPIEETAFDLLKQYIDSLRSYFAREEGRDEIINDIESRIAELFSERLKKGAVCITDDDVNAISASIGRPEDFEEDNGGSSTESASASAHSGQQQQQHTESASARSYNTGTGRGRLYRNSDDQILGGVCSGLANYVGIDPVVLRILFVLLIAPLFWVYILLWIVVPAKSIQTNITKRLYRSREDKVIAGVAGGLASYFKIDAWIPRLIFALPLLLALISGPFDFFWHDWGFWSGPKFITGSLGSTLFITYVILWIAVPVAVTASEKLEARGERVDINSIADTVKEDLESIRAKGGSFGSEVKQSAENLGAKAKEMGAEASQAFKTYSSEASNKVRSSGAGHVIGVLFKAFFLCIAGIIAIALFFVLLGLLFGSFSVFPLKNFLLEGFNQDLLAWLTLLLFLGIPIVALLTWLIRRIAGVRSKNNYLGYAFGSLWTIGLISMIVLLGLVSRNFKTSDSAPQQYTELKTSSDRLMVDLKPEPAHDYTSDWFGMDEEDWPFYAVNPDTLMLSTVRVDVVKSLDSNYHAKIVRLSRGRTPEVARALASKIDFPIALENNTLYLPHGFGISRDEKFRNQQVRVIIEVPVGKRIQLARDINNYESFEIRTTRRRNRYDDEIDRHRYWIEPGEEYIMTSNDGPRKVADMDEVELRKGNIKLRFKDKDAEFNAEINTGDSDENNSDDQQTKPNSDNNPNNEYRYRGREQKKAITDTVATAPKKAKI